MVNNPLPRARPLKKVGGIQLSKGWLLVWAAHRPAHEPHPGLSYALAPRRPAPLPQLRPGIPLLPLLPEEVPLEVLLGALGSGGGGNEPASLRLLRVMQGQEPGSQSMTWKAREPLVKWLLLALAKGNAKGTLNVC